MTLVYRPTPIVRFMHLSEHSSKQLKYRMARCVKHGSVFTHGPAPRNHRNTILFATCKRTTHLFFEIKAKVEMSSPPRGGAAFIPVAEAGGLSPRMYKWYNIRGTRSTRRSILKLNT
jgi:hypothetical protein